MRQIQIDFDAGLTTRYPTIMDMARHVVYGNEKQVKAIAADMDLSLSELSRKLADNPNDPRKLNLDELPAFIEANGPKGIEIIHWLVEKFIEDPQTRQQRAMDMLVKMAPLFEAAMKEITGGDAKLPPLQSVK